MSPKYFLEPLPEPKTDTFIHRIYQRWVGIPISGVFSLPFSEKNLISDIRVPTFDQFLFSALPISDTSDCSDPPLVFTIKEKQY